MSASWRAQIDMLAAIAGSTPEEFERRIVGDCEPTPNGRYNAIAIFRRAQLHWPDFFTPDDELPVAVWAELLDHWPQLTPHALVRAVDAVAHAGQRPLPRIFVDAALALIDEEAN